MPLINLIQEQRIATKKLQAKARLGLLSVAGAFTLGALSYGGLGIVSAGAQRQESELKAQIQRVKPILDEIKASEESYVTMQPRLTTLQSARESSSKWFRVLTYLTVHLPSQMYLTNVRGLVTETEKPVRVSFNGVSTDNSRIGEFILRLQEAPDLENPNLTFSAEKQVGDTQAIEFEVAGDIIGTEEQKPKKDADGEEAKS